MIKVTKIVYNWSIMRIVQRIATKQGHPVPSSSHAPRGPFPPELYISPEIVTDYASVDDEIPVGGTAQNNFQPPKVFQCSVCDVLVLEHEIPNHVCQEAGEDGTDS